MLVHAFTLFKDVQGNYYFRLRNFFGEVLLTGKTTSSKFSCLRQIASLRELAHADPIFHRMNLYNGYHFYVRIPDQPILGSGKVYSTWQEREDTIAAIQTNAHQSDVFDASTSIRFFRPINQSV